jgi:hypothetical protein
MLDKFIECYCHKNYKVLIIEGKPSDEQLLECWDKLLADYIELMGGDEHKDNVSKVEEINEASLRVNRVEAVLEVLNVAPTEGLFETLYTFGYELPKLKYNEDNLLRVCKLVIACMKRDVTNINMWSHILDEKNPKENKQLTEEVFYSSLVDLSETFGVVLDEKKLSVYSYVMYIKKHKTKIERLERQKIKK